MIAKTICLKTFAVGRGMARVAAGDAWGSLLDTVKREVFVANGRELEAAVAWATVIVFALN